MIMLYINLLVMLMIVDVKMVEMLILCLQSFNELCLFLQMRRQ